MDDTGVIVAVIAVVNIVLDVAENLEGELGVCDLADFIGLVGWDVAQELAVSVMYGDGVRVVLPGRWRCRHVLLPAV